MYPKYMYNNIINGKSLLKREDKTFLLKMEIVLKEIIICSV